jgi:acetyltransferase-like isoleucine patch superfamily enzyme
MTQWKRTKFRAFILRIQRTSFIYPGLRRKLLNFIGADIHPTATILHHCWLDSGDLEMGADSLLNAYAFFDGAKRLTLKDGARVAVYARFITGTHEKSDDPARRSSTVNIAEPIVIGRGVWIGTGSVVLPGVNVADGCIIGANSLVTKSTEPNGVYINTAPAGGGPVVARRVAELPG